MVCWEPVLCCLSVVNKWNYSFFFKSSIFLKVLIYQREITPVNVILPSCLITQNIASAWLIFRVDCLFFHVMSWDFKTENQRMTSELLRFPSFWHLFVSSRLAHSSLNSVNSSDSRSSGSHCHSPTSHFRYRASSSSSSVLPQQTPARLSSISSHDSGFISQDAYQSKSPSPMPPEILQVTKVAAQCF